MSDLRQRILDLSQTRDLSKFTYRQLAEILGGVHPYQVQYNIQQLVKKGLLLENKRTGSLHPARTSPQTSSGPSLLKIPILGSASCGVAVEYANNEHQGFVAVSPSLVNAKHASEIFALKAVGDSMNSADVHGSSIENGDFVIVRQSEWGTARDGDYVVSLIDDYANIKQLHVDRENRRIILVSRSREDYTPIVIAEEDLPYYRILGTVTDVVKAIPV
jgi:repressor LexA